ncbi:hypothetical protein IC235_21895 [Hymenobacter sp. BT664]|uniref:Uncharacterized protein n=1 Tax=Hymenobacter montanus TaxID=2771359 RepID=A0A927GLV3_9BACT|nr:hypothetical protein [Hymenobacter montanus]MBD2770546.1 hypothetical protein [Hymenobacter montanus]
MHNGLNDADWPTPAPGVFRGHQARGPADLRLSQDLEDLVHVVDNHRELTSEVAAAAAEVQAAIKQGLSLPGFSRGRKMDLALRLGTRASVRD